MITIEVSGGGILFTFNQNQHYLFDGEIMVPVNSLSLVTDESEMFTFYKAASNDIFISARYDDIGMTKEELESFYKNSMVASNGGSSIREIYVGTSGDSVNPDDCIITKLEGDKQWLNIVYEDQQGRCSLTKVSLNEFIVEQEFEDGLYVDSAGTVHGQVDDRDNNKVYIDYTSGGSPSASASVLSVGESGFTTSNIQEAIDSKVTIDRDIHTPISGNYITSAHSIVFNSKYDDELFEVVMPDAKPLSGVNGVDVVSGASIDVISGKVDPRQDEIVIGYNDDGTPTQTVAPLSVNSSGFTTNFIQDAINAKVLIDRRLYTPKEGEYDKSNQEITFKSDLNDELFKVKLSGDSELNSGSTNFVQNSAVTKAFDDVQDNIISSTTYVASSQTIEYNNRKNEKLFETVLSGDTELNSGSTNFLQNSAITKVIIENEEVVAAALNDLNDRKIDWESGVTNGSISSNTSAYTLSFDNVSGQTLFTIDVPKPEEGKVYSGGSNIVITSGDSFDTIAVSAATAITSASTEVVTSKAIYDELEKKQKRNVEISQADYDALVSAGTLDLEVLYLITDSEPINIKALSGINGVHVESGESIDYISGVVDSNSEVVITEYTSGGTSATTADVLSVGEDGFKLQNVQKAIDAIRHGNLIDMQGFTSGTTEDLFGILATDTISQAMKKIEDKLYKDDSTGLIFDENSDDVVILQGGTY